ncbi:hypothetical protein [Galbibacter pacificus]|uniref:PD-(D/E)XK endonuclease-like domain-containing protein n=1 Tax=Galbibacter pacificus TaxID=2996052 RepID=A0ABT6FWM2_9FLAO|nr:hypothetical protein [Galbibacter pacificus]MDG3584162.1 hypothetical protein [Galbibacter pacificus]MDG3587657.1 hypothetical protein [Galbibacter pacificus]
MTRIIKNIIASLLLLLFITTVGATEKDSIVTVDHKLYKSSAEQLDYLYSLNKQSNRDNWYIFFLGSDVEDLKYIINATRYQGQYDVRKLTALNDKLTAINRESPDYEVYAAITDYGKTLKVTSLFKGKTVNEHITEIEGQLSSRSLETGSPEQKELREARFALRHFSGLKKGILDSIYNNTTSFKQSPKKNHFLPYIMNLTYEKMANYEGDALRKQFFVWGMHPKKKEKNINQAFLKELYQKYKGIPDKSNIYRFSEDQMESVLLALEYYIDIPEVEGLKEGVGTEIYQLYVGEIEKGSEEDKKLIELANYLTDNYNGEHFVVDNADCLDYNCEVEEELITVISDFNIKTIEEFKDTFSYKGVARHYEGRKNVFTTYYSIYDLWGDLDVENYNKNSFDYYIQDGGDWDYEESDDYVEITDRYYYSLNDLLMRYGVFNDPQYSGIKRQIIASEDAGQASSISYEDFYDQYTSKYNTNSAYPFIAEWSSRWAEAPLIAYSGYRLVVEFGPFLMQELSKQIGKAGLEKIITEKGKDALQGAIIDYGLQATFNYILDDQYETFQEAAKPENINWMSVGWSAAESTIEYKSLLTELLTSGAGTCLINGYTDAKGFKEDFDFEACALNVVITYGVKALTSSPYIKKRASEAILKGKEKLRELFIKRGIPDDKADELIEAIEKGVDDIESTNGGNNVASGKTNNVLDELAEAAKDFAENETEIAITNNTISNTTKKFWANHEMNVTKYLRQIYGNTNVGRQITVDITLKNGNVITCRLDNLVKDGSIYKIIDAKSSTVQNLSTKTADNLVNSWSTPNQKTFYNALKNGNVQNIKPRGKNALEFFDVKSNNLIEPISIGNNVEFYVNDVAVDGYSIFKKIINF